MTAAVLRVAPHDVQHGDLLFGRTWTPVESILLDCSDGQDWVYGDAHGRTIARCKVWASVQVIRDLSGTVEAVSAASLPDGPGPGEGTPSRALPPGSDDCPPRGIARRHGLLVVVP